MEIQKYKYNWIYVNGLNIGTRSKIPNHKFRNTIARSATVKTLGRERYESGNDLRKKEREFFSCGMKLGTGGSRKR